MTDRDSAWGLLTEFTQSESLRKHALAVEACMRAYARKLGGDENLWGVVGLLHDFDYDRWPRLEDHPYKGNKILEERGYSDEIRKAIMSHAEYTGVPRETAMRFRAGAGGRAMTHAQYLVALVELHARVRSAAEAGDPLAQAALDELGLQSVTV